MSAMLRTKFPTKSGITTKYILSLGVAFATSSSLSLASIVQWADNGHYYERVDTSVTWAEAKAAAEAMTYNGMHGHLVTITSAAENIFLTTDPSLGNGLENLLHVHWTGGFQPAGSVEPDGGWAWTTGEGFVFSNWEPGEPNNYLGYENALIFDHSIGLYGKSWNDLTPDAYSAGFVVEFEPVPEASTCFAGIGALAMLALFGRRSRKSA